MRQGFEPDALADSLLAEALALDEADRAETLEGIRRGLQASDAGRVRRFAEFAAEMRAKYDLPTGLANAEIGS